LRHIFFAKVDAEHLLLDGFYQVGSSAKAFAVTHWQNKTRSELNQYQHQNPGRLVLTPITR